MPTLDLEPSLCSSADREAEKNLMVLGTNKTVLTSLELFQLDKLPDSNLKIDTLPDKIATEISSLSIFMVGNPTEPP